MNIKGEPQKRRDFRRMYVRLRLEQASGYTNVFQRMNQVEVAVSEVTGFGRRLCCGGPTKICQSVCAAIAAKYLSVLR
jgi:uncharacterized protein (DUF2237 family)